MTRILLVGGYEDGTSVEREGDIYAQPVVDGYTQVMIFGLPDPSRKWSTEGFSLVPAVFAPHVVMDANEAVFAAFAKWVDAQP